MRSQEKAPAKPPAATQAQPLQGQLFIAGHWCEGEDARTITRPFDQSVVGVQQLASAAQLDEALAAAHAIAPTLARTPAHQRSAWLRGITSKIETHREDFVDRIIAEGGKPRRFAEAEVARCLTTFSFAADEARRGRGESFGLDGVPAGEGRLGITRRFPVGVVSAITPFNFPLNLVAHKLAPAIAAGCPVLLKPADETPLTAALLCQLIADVGLPAGALAFVPCALKDVAPLTQDPRVALLSFTGSAAVGWSLRSQAGQSRVLLELGGNAAAIVHEDADLDHALDRCVFGAFAHSGQVCISLQRLYVQRPVYDQVLTGLIKKTLQLRCGDPNDAAVVVGPMRAMRDLDRVRAWVAAAEAAGATRHCGGEVQGQVLTPMVLTGVDPSQRVSCEEVFGPVLVVHPYDDFEEALEAVNDSPFGLQAGIFTRDLARVFEAHARLQVGALIHNDVPTYRVDPMPYGGVKGSGQGKEGLRYAIEAMSDERLLVISP